MIKQIDEYEYNTKDILGKGCFGTVYKGRNTTNDEIIAIKVVSVATLTPKLKQLLLNEIKTLKECNNINILKIYDCKQTENNIYLMLEYCELSGYDYLKKHGGKLQEHHAVSFIKQILNGFKSLVQHNIIHRDIKLDNIMLQKKQIKGNAIPKIIDFGFSSKTSLTDTMLGTPLTMAPEILDSKSYDNKIDIWSLGVVFYQLIAGKYPFTATNITDLRELYEQPIEFDFKISDSCKNLICEMLTIDVGKRISWEQLFKHPVFIFNDLFEKRNRFITSLETANESEKIEIFKQMFEFYENVANMNVSQEHENIIIYLVKEFEKIGKQFDMF
jgi:serine/threonine-protein kinase ULK/ATG1